MSISAVLQVILGGETGLSSAGFPTISESSFQLWMQKVPHLFQKGLELLDGPLLAARNGADASALRAIRVLETVVQTAAVTAPTDLWLLKHLLSTYRRTSLWSRLGNGQTLDLIAISQTEGLPLKQLRYDFHFFKSRGLVAATGADRYTLTAHPQVQKLWAGFTAVDSTWPTNMIPLLRSCLEGQTIDAEAQRQVQAFLQAPALGEPAPHWIPGLLEIEVGFRLVPLILAYRNTALYGRSEDPLIPADRPFAASMLEWLWRAGVVTKEGHITSLGRRVLERGPGPFGIIHAYHAYMSQHEALLHGQASAAWVSRGENVAASQDANRKTFLMINDSIDGFLERHHLPLKVFIEHAVGQGEATRQRFARSGAAAIQYVGADLEDAAIDRAEAAQKRGELPAAMRFIRKADIGDPRCLLDPLKTWGVSTEGAIMVVGNGFHEIRSQTNEKMVAVFQGYNAAGIILIFTEESALSDEDLLHTGWNTYHAGFRYVHELSGQGLRPAYAYDAENDRLSWKACLEKAGYTVHPGFTTQTRTIYPVPREKGYNPAISVNYFCLPSVLAGLARR